MLRMEETSTISRLANTHLQQVVSYTPGLTTEEAVSRYDLDSAQVIKLSSNENPLGPPPKAVEAIQKLLPELHRYPDSQALSLREKIAEREGLRPENVVIGAGSSETMSFVVRAFSRPGDEVVLMDPSFTVYAEIAAADGRQPVTIPLEYPFQPSFEDIKAALADRTRVIFLTRPNNPTSRLLPLSLFRQVAESASDAVVVSDEAYIEFADDYREETAVNLLSAMDNVIVTRTFSKAYGIPNARVGYAMGSAEAIGYLTKLKPKWNVGNLAQHAAIGALEDTGHFEKTLQTVHAGRAYLVEGLSQVGGVANVPDPQANFVMFRVADVGFTAEAFTEAMGGLGIMVRGDFHPDYIRISIANGAENETVMAAIRQVIGAS